MVIADLGLADLLRVRPLRFSTPRSVAGTLLHMGALVGGLVRGVVLLAATSWLAACREEPSSSPSDAGPSPFDFDPTQYSRDCTSDDDCVLLEGLRQCASCCSSTALRRDDAEQGYAAARAACGRPGAPPSMNCAMPCGHARAACFEQRCVKLPVDGGY